MVTLPGTSPARGKMASGSVDSAVDTSEVERDIATELAELLAETGALDLRDVLRRRPELRSKLNTAGIRLLPLCQLFPALFVLRVWWQAPEQPAAAAP